MTALIVPPDDLTELDQWVCWEPNKIPYQANGAVASSTDPTTWCSFDDAVAAWQARPDRFAGIGFAFSDADPFTGIDLDDCLDGNGEFKPWAQAIIHELADSYAEVSPSGTGVKLWLRGRLPGTGLHAAIEDGNIEMYDRGRYFTVTGRVISSAPREIEEHQGVIDSLYKRYSGKTHYKVGTDQKIPHGQQHNTLVSLAGTMRKRGLSPEAIFAALKIVNAQQCERPGPEKNIRAIAYGAAKWEAGTVNGNHKNGGLQPHHDKRSEQKDEPKIRRIEDIPALDQFDQSAVQWDVAGIVPSGTFLLFTGESGHGKSTVLTALADKVSRGELFLGRATRKRPVLLLDLENPITAIQERFQRLGICPSDAFRIWGQWTGEDPPAAGGAVVLEWVARCEVKPLIVVDSLVAFNPGSENDSNETRKYMAQYRTLTAMGCTVICLHHTGKSDSAKDYRGSSDIKASIDVGYKLTSLGDGATLSILELRAFKQRISVAPILGIRYRDGEFFDENYQAPKTTTERFTDLLKTNPGILKAQFEKLSMELGLTRSGGRAFIEGGVEYRTIRTETGPNNSTLHYWRGATNLKTQTEFE